MTARKKRAPRSTSADTVRPDLQEIVALHVRASQRRDEILEEVKALKSAGKIREARELLRQAQTIQAHLTALERECKLPPRNLRK